MTVLAIVLATLGAFAGLYEWTAIVTHRVPTITRTIQALPTPAELAIVFTAIAAILDHFLLHIWLG